MTWQDELKRDLKKVHHHVTEANKLLAKCKAITDDGAILTDADLTTILNDSTEIAKEVITLRRLVNARITQREKNNKTFVNRKPQDPAKQPIFARR